MKPKLTDYNNIFLRYIKRFPSLTASQIADKIKSKYSLKFASYKAESLRRHIDFCKSVVETKPHREIEKEKVTKIVAEFDKKYPELDCKAVAVKINLKFKERTIGTLAKMVSGYRQFRDISHG